jgi:hypothetical protein
MEEVIGCEAEEMMKIGGSRPRPERLLSKEDRI